MGLYLKNIIPFFLCVILLSKEKNKFLFATIFIIGIIYAFYVENDFAKIKNEIESGKYILEIISEKIESDYTNKYTAKIDENEKLALKNKKVYLLLDKEEKEFKIGDKIFVYAEKMEESNYNNFNQYDNSKYQKQSKIYGTLKVTDMIMIKKNNKINIKSLINDRLKELFEGEEEALFLSIVLGNKNYVSAEILNNFVKSGFSHIIAVSGAHLVYIISSSEKMLKIFNIGKREGKIALVIIILFFYYIVGFTSSIGRSILMSLLAQIADLMYKKKNTLNSLFISAFIILIYNPFLIENAGFILTYLGTIGIVEFEPLINKIIMKNKIYKKAESEYIFCIKKYSNYEKEKIKIQDEKINMKEKIRKYIKLYKSTNGLSIVEKYSYFKFKILSFLFENLSVSIAVNIFSIPATIYLFNSINLLSIISSILVSPVSGAIVSIGIIIIFFCFIPKVILKIPIMILNILLKTMIILSEMFKGFSINITTPSIISIIFIYSYFIWKIAINKDKRILYKYLKFLERKVKYKACKKIKKVRKDFSNNIYN